MLSDSDRKDEYKSQRNILVHFRLFSDYRAENRHIFAVRYSNIKEGRPEALKKADVASGHLLSSIERNC